MGDLRFEVSGSTGSIYELTFVTRNGVTSFLCTCDAGRTGIHCKHRIGLIEGDMKSLLSDNHGDVTVLIEAVKSGPIGKALEGLRLAEREQEAAKRKTSAAKKKLAQALLGRA